MVAALPDETTQLLIEICTGTDPLVSEPDTLPTPSKPAGGGSYLSYLALRAPAPAAAPVSPVSVSATATTVTDPPVSSGASSRTARQNDRGSRREATFDGSRAPSPPSTLRLAPPPIKRPSPRLYFANFVGHREHLVVFLEAVALRRWGQSLDEPRDGAIVAVETGVKEEGAEAADQQAVWNTLLELYLTLASAAGSGARGDVLRDKALRLLRAAEHLPYDPTHALILCATRGFTPGLVLLWERLGMHEDVLRFWMEQDRRGVGVASGAGAEVMRCLALYGGAAPQLYKLALRFFTSAPELMARHTQDLAEVLRVIEERAIMPPLVVVQVLSRNDVASVGLVKDWLLARIRTAREEVHTVRDLFFLKPCFTMLILLVWWVGGCRTSS